MTWPETLPQILLIEGYAESMADTSIRSSMDTGPAKVRKRTSAAIRPLKGTIILTETQLAAFKNFYITDLSGGALRFTWEDPVTEEELEMRFTAPPSWKRDGLIYKVNLDLEILP